MPLSYNELTKLVDTGVITGVTPDRINAASIDVTLDKLIWVESSIGRNKLVDLAEKPRQFPEYVVRDITPSFTLRPADFILAATVEKFYLPNDICAEYRLNSSLARAGLNAALAMWCDPGWNDAQLTLELKNWTLYHNLLIRPGMKIGQMIFHQVTLVPEERSYATIGSYNGTNQGPSVR